MNKKETIWREILCQAIEHKRFEFSQKELAESFNFSLSTVFNSLKIPRQIGAVRVGGRGFEVQDIEKFLYLWATHRNIEKDVLYKTDTGLSVKETEGSVPPFVIFGCYSAYSKKYKDEPADYDKVFIYSDSKRLKEIKERFPEKKGYENLIVLKSDPYLYKFGYTTPDAQTFVDLWNIKEWYAKEFLNALKGRMF